ncbi:MAG: hypothetical protein E7560_00305 [Ruminococcaceae bacterium]|nr:hypothetical protein [Oscillospiraceae bacterium]
MAELKGKRVDFTPLHLELKEFYGEQDFKARDFNEFCSNELEKRVNDDMSSFTQKGIQYETIAELCPVALFKNSSFYYEIGTMSSLCNGHGENASTAKVQGLVHPGGWVYRRNKHLFIDVDPVLYKKSRSEFYEWSADYGDPRFHKAFNMEPALTKGLKGVYEDVKSRITDECTEKERDFLENMCKGLLAMKTISEKFSKRAKEMLKTATDEAEIKRLERIAEAAARTPWEVPQNFWEALNAVFFLDKVMGGLEGVAIETMGRLDCLLNPFYEKDIENGVITREKAYDLIAEFLLTWDAHHNHERNIGMITQEGATYTLGGCDKEGNPVFNEMTKMFLEATSEHKIINPKIMCRYSASSPKEYIDLLNHDVLRGTSTIQYQNDDAFIPALLKIGVELPDANNYHLLGCWEPAIENATNEHCTYMYLLKIFERSIYNDSTHEEIKILPIEDAKSFEEVYDITIQNFRTVLEYKFNATYKGRAVWEQVDPLMLVSSAMSSCLDKKKDCTGGGAKYQIDDQIFAGVPNVVDSLLVIKELCFDKKVCTLKELLSAVKNNWEGAEDLRKQALGCSFWGDEKEVSGKMMGSLVHDLYEICDTLPCLYDGKVAVGFMLFLEVFREAKHLRATPDGRRNFEHFARGLTPSGLHQINSPTSLINSLKYVDSSEVAGNSAINLTLPFTPAHKDVFSAFVKTTADSAAEAVQINCVTKETLLDARKHPENYCDLVIRVCGYSARFVTLDERIQDDIISRNFYTI